MAVSAPGCDQSAMYWRFSLSEMSDRSTWLEKVFSKNQSKPLV